MKAFVRDVGGVPAIFSRDLGLEVEAHVGEVYKRFDKQVWAALPVWDGPFPPLRERPPKGWYIEAYYARSTRAEWHAVASSVAEAIRTIISGKAEGLEVFRILEPLDATEEERRTLFTLGNVHPIA